MWDCAETSSSSSFLLLLSHRAPPLLLRAIGVPAICSFVVIPSPSSAHFLCGPEQSGLGRRVESTLPCFLVLFSPSCWSAGFTGWQGSAVARASQFFVRGQVTSGNRAALTEANASIPTFLKDQSLIQSGSTRSQFFFFLPGVDGKACAGHSEGWTRTVITLFLLRLSLLVILKLHIPS